MLNGSSCTTDDPAAVPGPCGPVDADPGYFLGRGGAPARYIIGLTNLARTLAARERHSAALAYIEQARSALDSVEDRHVTLEIKTLAIYADLLTKTGDPVRAGEFFDRSMALCEANLGADHYLMGQLLVLYADFLEQSRRKSEARSAEKRAKALTSAR